MQCHTLWGFLTVLLLTLNLSNAYAQIEQANNCDIKRSIANTKEPLAKYEKLIQLASSSLEHGEHECAKKIIDTTNTIAKTSTNQDIQAKIFYRIKDVLLNNLEYINNNHGHVLEFIESGLQHEYLSTPTDADYYADVTFLVQSVEKFPKGENKCEAEKIFTRAAKLEEKITKEYGRYITMLHIEKHFDRSARNWCLSQMTTTAKIVSITHPEIKSSDFLVRKTYMRLTSFGEEKAYNTEPHLIDYRIKEVTSLIKQLETVGKVKMRYMSENAAQHLIGKLRFMIGILEYKRGNENIAYEKFKEVFDFIGTFEKPSARSYYRLDMVSFLLTHEVELAANFLIATRKDLEDIKKTRVRMDKIRRYNKFVQRIERKLGRDNTKFKNLTPLM